MIYVIDHKDSFTHNVVHQFSLFDKVCCDDFSEINKSKLNKASTIVFSPGPGSPKNYPISSKIYDVAPSPKSAVLTILDLENICGLNVRLHNSTLQTKTDFLMLLLISRPRVKPRTPPAQPYPKIGSFFISLFKSN